MGEIEPSIKDELVRVVEGVLTGEGVKTGGDQSVQGAVGTGGVHVPSVAV